MKIDKVRKRLTIFSIAVYLLSLFLVGYNGQQGIIMVAFGFFYFANGNIYLAWLANPILLLFLWRLNKYTRKRLIASLICFALQFWVLNYNKAENPNREFDIFNDNVTLEKVHLELGAGYYLWVSSCLVMVFSNGYQLYFQAKQKRNFAQQNLHKRVGV